MNGRGDDKVDREEEGVTEAVAAAAETEAEEAEVEEMERERDDCARWWWREECKRREGWRESEREAVSEGVGAEEEEGALCRGGGGGKVSVGGEGLWRTDWMRPCWVWDRAWGRCADTDDKRVEAGW